MDRKIKKGKCHLCGRVRKLSLEHVPPEKAFNSSKSKLFGGEQLIGRDNLPWDFENLQAEHHQNGIGGNTLCIKCNSNTGGWYARSYIDFALKGYEELLKNKPAINTSFSLNLRDIYPLRIAKQILVMFMSINNQDFLDKDLKLRKLLMSKTTRGIDTTKYAIGIYVNGSEFAKYVGLSAVIKGKEITLISELNSIPFGFVFILDPLVNGDVKKYCNITNLINKFEYNDRVNIELTLPVYDSNTVFPADYRSRKQILDHSKKNRQYFKRKHSTE